MTSASGSPASRSCSSARARGVSPSRIAPRTAAAQKAVAAAEQRGKRLSELLRLERAVLEERQLPAVERFAELRVFVREREARQEICGEAGAEGVEPRRLAGGLRRGDRKHGADSVGAPVEALEEHRACGDRRRRGEPDRGDRVGELAGRVGRLGRARFQCALELEDAKPVGLAAEVCGEQPVGLRPELCELAGCSEADADVRRRARSWRRRS